MNFENWRWLWRIFARALRFAVAGFLFFGGAGGICLAIATIIVVIFSSLVSKELDFSMFFASFFVAGYTAIVGTCAGASVGALMMFILGIIGPPENFSGSNLRPDVNFIFPRAWKMMAFSTFSVALSLCVAYGITDLLGLKFWRERNLSLDLWLPAIVIGAMIVGMFFGGAWGLQDWRRDYENSK